MFQKILLSTGFRDAGACLQSKAPDLKETPEYWFNEAVRNNTSSAIAYIIRAGFYRNIGKPDEFISRPAEGGTNGFV